MSLLKEDIQRVKDFIKYDAFFDELADKYTYTIGLIGHSLMYKNDSYVLSKSRSEVADYLDGNNFIVEYGCAYGGDTVLRPQYSDD